ncbi:MAG: hypothetical protein AAB701_02855 [Patescibacteria group bacterium]
MKNTKQASSRVNKDSGHPMLQNIYLSYLFVLVIASGLTVLSQFAVTKCIDDACTATIPAYDPASFGIGIIGGILGLLALWMWHKQNRPRSIQLTQASLILLCLGAGALWMLFVQHYGDPANQAQLQADLAGDGLPWMILYGTLSLLPFFLLYLVTHSRQQIMAGKPHHQILKGLFVVQLLITFSGSHPSVETFGTWLWTIISLATVVAFLAFLFGKRAVSVRISQYSLAALAILNSVDIINFFVKTKNSGLLAEVQSYLEQFPLLLPLTLLVSIGAPLIALSLITRYKRQIIED